MVNKSVLICKNKIITSDNLNNIFKIVDEKCQELDKIYQKESKKNAIINYNYQEWTYKNLFKRFASNIEFDDDTGIKLEKISNFSEIFNQRVNDIKYAHFSLYLSYEYNEYGMTYKRITSYFYIDIKPDLIKCNFEIDDEDMVVKEFYNYIESMILNAPEIYDNTIKKYKTISLLSDLAINFIPTIIISFALLFNEKIHTIASTTYVFFPMCFIVLLIVINSFISPSGIKRLYDKIIPKKRAGYSNGNRIYKYDMEKLVDTCWVLVGSNINNLEYRNKIKQRYDFLKKLFLIDLLVFVISTIIVIFI